MIHLNTHLGKLFGVVNSSFIKRNSLHDNVFENTSTKVGLLAARFSHLLGFFYDTSAANILDMQYVQYHSIPLLVRN